MAAADGSEGTGLGRRGLKRKTAERYEKRRRRNRIVVLCIAAARQEHRLWAGGTDVVGWDSWDGERGALRVDRPARVVSVLMEPSSL